MQPKVSILITTYNCEETVDRAIGSVIAQNLPNEWELLIGDDGSIDGTKNRIQIWMTKYPNHIYLYEMPRYDDVEKNGTRAARNRANLLEKANGEYIHFLDGDDWFLGTDKIESQIQILEDERYSCCSGVAHNILVNDMEKQEIYPLIKPNVSERIVDNIKYWKHQYFHTNTILFRSECKALMLQDTYRDYLNDNFITYLILQCGQLYYIPEAWAQYNLTGEGLWTGKKRIYGCFRNLILYELEKEINSGMERACFIRHLYDFGYIFEYYDQKDREKVEGLFKGTDLLTRFPNLYLMFKSDEDLSVDERREKNILRRRVKKTFWKERVFSILNRMI